MEDNTSSIPDYHRVSILLLGAGAGTRMGGLSKAFLKIGNETALERVVRVARSVASDIVVGLSASDFEQGQQLVGSHAKIIVGGSSRQKTIERLALVAKGDVTVVHDVARPYATPETYTNILKHVPHHPACVPALAIPVRDSLCRGKQGFVDKMIERKNLMTLQTPQAYDARLLLRLLLQATQESRSETSLVALFNQAGLAVKLVNGHADNIKITYRCDLPEDSSNS